MHHGGAFFLFLPVISDALFSNDPCCIEKGKRPGMVKEGASFIRQTYRPLHGYHLRRQTVHESSYKRVNGSVHVS